MKIHEYQSKKLLNEFGIPVPKSKVSVDKDELLNHFNDFGSKAVLKVQVHAGGRGKAGGVKLVDNKEDAVDFADNFFGNLFQTFQTGDDSVIVNKILVEEASKIVSEMYLALLVDGSNQSVNIIASPEGGTDIEEVASTNPEKIFSLPINTILGPSDFHVREILDFLSLEKNLFSQLNKIIRGLYKLYLDKDCSLIEINPLILNEDNEIIALDAKITFDEDALFRNKDIVELRDLSQENEVETKAAELGIKYVQLKGSVGCIVNGAGLAMATMDVIQSTGLNPANFLDIGGGADEDKVSKAMLAVLSDENVKIVLVNLFGGILRCDVAARGFILALKEFEGTSPKLIIRMQGTNSEEGKRILSETKFNISFAENLDQISQILSKEE
ncbi:MAG: ADP-forming succinate--CoA ligase subunit beta [Dehalococcoidia bacterium]